MRRLRRTASLRDLVREHHVDPADLILPVFVHQRPGREPIEAMPGVERLSIDELMVEADEVVSLGLGGLILFGIPDHKDPEGTGAYDDEGIIQLAIRALKARHPELVVLADLCLCEYTDHGHCGIVSQGPRGEVVIDNDTSLDLLGRTAVAQARAGADAVAPSDMMDGRVAAIRAALDAEGFEDVPIIAYSAKFASAFYGPFRDAAGSTPAFGDRRTYQMDPANRREALRETRLDVEEGADMLIVKPALPYLDILRDTREAFELPIIAYNVSGEYAMLKAAAANGWLDERAAVLEALTSMKRAGADLILTYHAKDAARWL
jgi:porphobilinogen synthase